ncbi:MAG TPA: HAMP domain-containing sensor histidine kinase [Rhodothermales bacterium]|nr:HAMP domain-containing sensor histidine kinase [Rhodothermales bacterium]
MHAASIHYTPDPGAPPGQPYNSRDDGEMEEARRRIKQLEKLDATFLCNLSHEIRTPLTGILGFAEVLAEEVGGEHRELALLIGRSGERLMETLTGILDLVQLERGEFELNLEPLSPVQCAREAVNHFRLQAGEKGLSMTLDANGCGDVLARTDSFALRRIITNLISNAIKFTRQGTIRVSFEADRERVTLHVIDTGIGIREEFLPFIFDEFKQESEGTSRHFEGTGVGLAVCRRMATLLHADLSVESSRGVGSIFSLTLRRMSEIGASNKF